MEKTLEWSHKGRESLNLKYQIVEGQFQLLSMKAIGCLSFLRKSQDMKRKLQGAMDQWELPQGDDHSSMIWREVFLRLQDQWQRPVSQEEICHCRKVSTATVDHAIVYGTENIDQIRSQTSANTGCGTCRDDVLSLLSYRKA